MNNPLKKLMANRKNREQLTEEAQSLGIDFSTFETNAQFVEAIAAKNAENPDSKKEPEVEVTGETERPVNTDTDLENPTDDQGDIEAPMDPSDEPKKKRKKSKDVVVRTTRAVQININGNLQEGTEFSFPADVAEDRKKVLTERYGAGVIEE